MAGPDEQHLAERGVFKLTNDEPWTVKWLTTNQNTLYLEADDTIIEVRNAGAAHGAKIFSAFLLAP
jgi:hypothetical protein